MDKYKYCEDATIKISRFNSTNINKADMQLDSRRSAASNKSTMSAAIPLSQYVTPPTMAPHIMSLIPSTMTREKTSYHTTQQPTTLQQSK
jgi:hypothetical protein